MKDRDFATPMRMCDCNYVVQVETILNDCKELDLSGYFSSLEPAIKLALDNGFEPDSVFVDGEGNWKKVIKKNEYCSRKYVMRIVVRPLDVMHFCDDCYWTKEEIRDPLVLFKKGK